MSTLERAVAIAAQAHEGQVDKGGQPYILHPLRVMMAVEPEDRIAAVLHDVMEDCPHWTVQGLRNEGFGESAIEALVALTRGSDEGYNAFIRRAGANPMARRVKLADLSDNMNLSRIAKPTLADCRRVDKYERATATLRKMPEVSGDG